MLVPILKDILPAIIVVALLYFCNQKFDIKRKLRSKFVSDDSYRVTLLLIPVFMMMGFSFISKDSFLSHPIGPTIFFSALYLSNIPEKKSNKE